MAGDVKDGTFGFHLMGEASVIPTPVPIAERFIDLRYPKAAGIQ